MDPHASDNIAKIHRDFDASDTIEEIHSELHSDLPPEPALRAKALESLLVEKGLLPLDAVDN